MYVPVHILFFLYLYQYLYLIFFLYLACTCTYSLVYRRRSSMYHHVEVITSGAFLYIKR